MITVGVTRIYMEESCARCDPTPSDPRPSSTSQQCLGTAQVTHKYPGPPQIQPTDRHGFLAGIHGLGGSWLARKAEAGLFVK